MGVSRCSLAPPLLLLITRKKVEAEKVKGLLGLSLGRKCRRSKMMLLLGLAVLLSLLHQGVVGQCPPPAPGATASWAPHPQQCDRYVECRNGTVTEGQCPDGLAFNPRTTWTSLKCDYLTEVDCTNRPQLQSAQTRPHCPRRWGLYAHETDCNRFWNCVDGTPYEFICPEGLAFNEERSHCDWPDNVDRCDSAGFLGFQCPNDEYASPFELPHYAHTSDCRKHFVCVYGTDNKRHPRLQSCDEGRVFNADTSLCDKPENVPGCENYYGRQLTSNLLYN